MKYRFLLPAIYILLVCLFFVFFVKGAAHGWNPFGFVFYLTFPAGFLLELMPTSWSFRNGLLLLLLFMLVGLLQWILIGYLIDKLVARHRKRHAAQNVGQS